MATPDPIAWLRSTIAGEVRSRTSGDLGQATFEELLADERPGWYEPGASVYLVHGDPAMFVGGLRAILLQSLHPLAMAGVAQHSDYRSDPWGRLQRTAQFLVRTSFGSAEQAEAACAQVKAVHRRVRGIAPDGRAYSANDPHLIEWVHLAEVDSFLSAHQRYGRQRLTPMQADRYVAEMARIAEGLGVVAPPRSTQELKAAIARFRPELRSTREAREAAWFLLQPPLPLPARAPYGVLYAAAAGLLPLWARFMLRMPVAPLTERFAVPAVMRAELELLRWALASGEARPMHEHPRYAVAGGAAAGGAPTAH
jgi:uncharacterized protein (DUF2236 family)